MIWKPLCSFSHLFWFLMLGSLDIWHWSFYYEIFTPVQYNVSEKCFYEKSKVVLQCSKAEKSCVEIKDAAKKSGDFDVPCSNILLRNQLSRTFLQKLKFFFKPIKAKKMVNFALIMRKNDKFMIKKSTKKIYPCHLLKKKMSVMGASFSSFRMWTIYFNCRAGVYKI